jgi:hypothetical protein
MISSNLLQWFGIVATFAGIVGGFTRWILSRLEGRLDGIEGKIDNLGSRVSYIEGMLKIDHQNI